MHAAYRSTAYAAAREDVHLLLQQAATNSPIRADLRCPFPEIEDKKARAPSSAKSAFSHLVAKAMAEGQNSRPSAPTTTARRVRAAPKDAKGGGGNVVSMEQRRESDLEASMAVLSQGLKLR